MSESATEAKIRDLSRQLKNEQTAHARTRYQLQGEIERVWGLVPGYWINLMGVYPTLRQLVAILVDAANLQDPSRAAPIEDTMRVEFIHTGDNASTSATEAGVFSHHRHRHNVKEVDRRIGQVAHELAKLIGGDEWQFKPPDGQCVECGKHLFQSPTGRPRSYCSDECRYRAARNDTKQAQA